MGLYNKIPINYEVLMEAYAGKPKEFIKCERLLQEIVDQIKKDNKDRSNVVRTRNVVKDYPANKELCKTLEDFFKVTKINIYWDSGMSNAFTLKPSSFSIASNKGRYLDNRNCNLDVFIVIYEDLVVRCDLTAQELMAVILHEIGHNFYFCPIKLYSELILTIVTFPIGLIYKFIGKAIYKFAALTTDIIKQHFPLLYNIIDLYNYLLNTIYDYIKPLTVLRYGMSAIYRFVNDPSFNLSGYGDEKGADSFAAKYGYGPEQASALQKMESPMNTHYAKQMSKRGENTGASIMEDLCALSVDLVAGLTLDPHPNNNQRASSMLKKLEHDLETGDYPPEMKRSLENEIVRMRKAYEVINDPKFGGDVEIRKGWYKILDTATNGHSDLRELFNFYFDSFRF